MRPQPVRPAAHFELEHAELHPDLNHRSPVAGLYLARDDLA